MITTGIIKKINVDSDSHKNNKVTAEIGIFKTPGITDDSTFTYDCNCCVPGGIYSPYNVGDKVYIGFLNNNNSLPIILGKIYQGLEDESRSFAYFNKLQVERGAVLPKDTKIGDVSLNDLLDLKTRVSLLEDRYNHSATNLVLATDALTNLYGYKNNNYTIEDHTTYTSILYNGSANLTGAIIKNYMKYMTGVDYIPGSDLQNSSIYQGGLLLADGSSGYYETVKSGENNYELKIIWCRRND